MHTWQPPLSCTQGTRCLVIIVLLALLADVEKSFTCYTPSTAGHRQEVWRCLTAGHSLGGALATLAAYDIQGACDYKDKLDLSCYTFGAPRTGNHAFAYDYNDKVAPLVPGE